jgi:hypothetical protein
MKTVDFGKHFRVVVEVEAFSTQAWDAEKGRWVESHFVEVEDERIVFSFETEDDVHRFIAERMGR